MSFRLIEVLKPEVGAEFERAQRKAQLGRTHMNLGDGGSLRIAKIGNGKFDGGNF